MNRADKQHSYRAGDKFIVVSRSRHHAFHVPQHVTLVEDIDTEYRLFESAEGKRQILHLSDVRPHKHFSPPQLLFLRVAHRICTGLAPPQITTKIHG